MSRRRLRGTAHSEGPGKAGYRLDNYETNPSLIKEQEITSDRLEGLPTPQRYWAVAGVWLALIVSVLDSSIANIALPSIAHDLGTKPADSIAVVSGFQLGALVSLLPLSALGEIITYRRVFLGGLALFTVASLGCVLSHTLLKLVLSRAIQGVGAAGIMSVNGALARHIYPHRLLGAALGSNALIIAGFSALGPTIAAGILLWGPWQWLFLMNLPVCIIALALGFRSLPDSARARRKLDLVSTILNIVGLSLISSGVDLATGEQPTRIGGLLIAAGVVVVAALVRRSMHQNHPLVPVDLLKIRLARLSAMTSTATFLAQTLTLISLPFYFQEALHLSTVQTGLLMTPWPVGIALAAPAAGWLADRISVSVLSGCGLLVMTGGLTCLLWLSGSEDHSIIGLEMGICGIGFGFFQAPNNRTLMSSAPLERAGAAAGLIAISRTTGQIFGAMLLAILFRLLGQAGRVPIGLSALFAATAALISFARGSSVNSKSREL